MILPKVLLFFLNCKQILNVFVCEVVLGKQIVGKFSTEFIKISSSFEWNITYPIF